MSSVNLFWGLFFFLRQFDLVIPDSPNQLVRLSNSSATNKQKTSTRVVFFNETEKKN